MSTLAEITGVERDLLRKKFQLEPQFCYDPNRSENLAFMSPLVLLKDSELKPGGREDHGPKTTLGRVAKDILEADGHMLLQVPEVTYLHLGYAKKSANKKGRMAINEVAAKEWKSFLNMSRFTRSTSPSEPTSDVAEPMEIDFPTSADTQALEVEYAGRSDPRKIQPSESGLKIPLKGRYLLLFSILLIFFDKKKKKKTQEDSTKNEDKIGANKVSDFLLFWILPHLLNFNQRKVHEIIQHYRSISKESEFDNFVEKSASDIIKESFESSELSEDLQDFIEKKYRDCYGEKMDTKYKLFKTKDDSPIIVVPKNYQVKEMPAALEDIGKDWRKIGNITLLDDLMEKFIKDPEIQQDFFLSLKDLKHRQGIDYAIILPNEKTFSELLRSVKNESSQILTPVKGCGRKLVAPKMALITETNKHLTVCFSYIQGKGFLFVVTNI